MNCAFCACILILLHRLQERRSHADGGVVEQRLLAVLLRWTFVTAVDTSLASRSAPDSSANDAGAR